MNAEYNNVFDPPTKGKVGDNNTAAAENQTDLVNAVEIFGGSEETGFQVGYPTVDLSSLSAEERFRLGTTDANGELLVEAGIFSDGDVMKSRATFSSISKTDQDIAIFVFRTKVRNTTIGG